MTSPLQQKIKIKSPSVVTANRVGDGAVVWRTADGTWSRELADAAIVRSDKCKEMVAGYVDELNTQLNRWETIKKWELLDHDLSVESGELTPSMKVKRNVVETNYSDVIDGFYG